MFFFFFFSSRRRHTRSDRDWSSDVCSSDLGQSIPTNIVDKLSCRLAGREIFSAELGTGISANPYIVFYTTADASGELVVEWSDDRGEKGRVTTTVNVA